MKWRSINRRFESGNRLREDLLLTLGASLSLAFTLLVFNATAARILGVEDFGFLQSVRNLATLVVPVLTLSQAIALPRFMATEARGDQAFVAGLQIFLVVATAGGVVVLILAPYLTAEHLTILALAAVLALGMGNARLVESGLRGYHSTRGANLVKGPVNGAIHLTALLLLLLYPDWISAIIGLLVGYGLLMVFALRLLLQAGARIRSEMIGPLRRRLFIFGLGRTPAGLLKSLVFSLPFLIFSAKSDFESAAIFAVGLYFVRISEAVVTGISPSIIYQTARMKAGDTDETVSKFVNSLMEGVVFMSAAILIFIVAWRVEIVNLVFGPKYVEAVAPIAFLSFAIVPQCIFVVLRGVVDVLRDKAVNTLIMSLAVIAQVGLVFALATRMPLLDSVVIASLAAVSVMALGVIVSAFPAIRLGVSWLEWLKVALGLAVLVLSNILVGRLAAGWSGLFLGFVASLVVGGGLIAAFQHRWYALLFSRRGSL